MNRGATMSGLSKYDREKLLHDIKRVSKGIKIMVSERNKEKQEFIGSLLQDEVDRLYQDVEEMTEKGKGNT